MIMLWIVFCMLLVVAGLICVAFLILKNSMDGIGNIIIEHFEKETKDIDSIDELIAYHRENPTVDYVI